METKLCRLSGPPCCRGSARVSAGDTQGCCYFIGTSYAEGGGMGVDSDDVPVTCGDGCCCCCGTGGTAGGVASEDSGDTQISGGDGWCHTLRPCDASEL